MAVIVQSDVLNGHSVLIAAAAAWPVVFRYGLFLYEKIIFCLNLFSADLVG